MRGFLPAVTWACWERRLLRRALSFHPLRTTPPFRNGGVHSNHGCHQQLKMGPVECELTVSAQNPRGMGRAKRGSHAPFIKEWIQKSNIPEGSALVPEVINGKGRGYTFQILHSMAGANTLGHPEETTRKYGGITPPPGIHFLTGRKISYWYNHNQGWA